VQLTSCEATLHALMDYDFRNTSKLMQSKNIPFLTPSYLTSNDSIYIYFLTSVVPVEETIATKKSLPSPSTNCAARKKQLQIKPPKLTYLTFLIPFLQHSFINLVVVFNSGEVQLHG